MARLSETSRLSRVSLTGSTGPFMVSSIRPARVSVSVVAWVRADVETPRRATASILSLALGHAPGAA